MRACRAEVDEPGVGGGSIDSAIRRHITVEIAGNGEIFGKAPSKRLCSITGIPPSLPGDNPVDCGNGDALSFEHQRQIPDKTTELFLPGCLTGAAQFSPNAGFIIIKHGSGLLLAVFRGVPRPEHGLCVRRALRHEHFDLFCHGFVSISRRKQQFEALFGGASCGIVENQVLLRILDDHTGGRALEIPDNGSAFGILRGSSKSSKTVFQADNARSS